MNPEMTPNSVSPAPERPAGLPPKKPGGSKIDANLGALALAIVGLLGAVGLSAWLADPAPKVVPAAAVAAVQVDVDPQTGRPASGNEHFAAVIIRDAQEILSGTIDGHPARISVGQDGTIILRATFPGPHPKHQVTVVYLDHLGQVKTFQIYE